nr:zinc finger BED domain-containing protein RICESLEEPER 2-like [Malus domestica]
MDARDSNSVTDEESVEIIMGTERNLGSESIDNTNSSSTKKKARTINLVQDGLKEIDSSVVKIRECIKYVKGSEARKLKFQECVKQVGIIDSKRGLSDSNFESCPTSEEWDKVVKISKFLGYFYDVTCLFSGTKYPTSNLFFPKVFVIQLQIKAAIDDCDSFMNKMGDYMHMKFQKYWSNYSLIMSIAIILDLRYKLHFVDWAYTKLHGVNSMEYKNVHGTLIALFNVYSEISAHLNYSNIPMNSMPNHQTEGGEGDALFEDFDNNYNGPNSVKKGELQKYLDDKIVDRRQDIDVLSWWQMERFHYPILSQLARDVLTIPISTVASESAFSIGGKVLDQYRTLLLPDTIQALLCTRDWLFGKGVYAEESANVESLNESIFNITLEDNISSQNSNTFSHGD